MHPSFRLPAGCFDMSGMQVPNHPAAAHGQASSMYPFLSLPAISSLLASSMQSQPGSPGTPSMRDYNVHHQSAGHSPFGHMAPMGFMASPLPHIAHPAAGQADAAFDHHRPEGLGHGSMAKSAAPALGQPRKRAPEKLSSGSGSSRGGGGGGVVTGMEDGSGELTILPRRRAGQPEDMKRDPIVLTRKDLQELYSMRLSEAAAKLVRVSCCSCCCCVRNFMHAESAAEQEAKSDTSIILQDISVTAMKAVCRKAGISKWPYRRIQFYKSRGMLFNADEVFLSGSRTRRSSKRERF
jgi:hypothetical protein